jgi:hypothetical protein
MFTLAFGKLDATAAGVLTSTAPDRTVIVRSQGSTFVVDIAVPDDHAKAAAVKELLRTTPLRPVRAFAARGTARRFDPSDAIAMWIDLAGIARWDARVAAAKPKCATALRASGTFDDLFATMQLRGPDAARLEVVLGSTIKKLAVVAPPTPARPLRTLAPDGDAMATFVLGDVGWLPALLSPMAPVTLAKVKATGELDPDACDGNAGTLLTLLRRWPELMAVSMVDEKNGQSDEVRTLRVLASIRAGAIWAVQKPGEDPLAAGGVGFLEVADAARGDLDRLLSRQFSPTNPLRLESAQLTTYMAPAGFAWFGPDPLLVLEPLNEGGTIIGLGTRDRLRASHAGGVRPADGNVPRYVARLTLSPQLVRAAAGNLRVSGVEIAPLTDGIGKIEAELVREAEALRLSTDVTITSRP